MISQSETGKFVVCGDTEGHNTVSELIEYYKTSPIEPFGEYLTSSCFEVSENLFSFFQIRLISDDDLTGFFIFYCRLSMKSCMISSRSAQRINLLLLRNYKNSRLTRPQSSNRHGLKRATEFTRYVTQILFKLILCA